jgi:hypothetical protein
VDSFSISCTTCQAKLKVRDPSVIGQILTCPKCGSMVLVSPPGASAGIADGGNSTEHVEQKTGPAKTATSRPPSLPPTLPTGVDASTTAAAVNELGLADPEVHSAAFDEFADEGPVLPTDEWASDTSRAWRSWLQVAIAATIGILFAVGFLMLVAGQFGSEEGEDSNFPSADVEDPTALEVRTASEVDVETSSTPDEDREDKGLAGIAPETPAESEAPVAAGDNVAIGSQNLTDVPTETETPVAPLAEIESANPSPDLEAPPGLTPPDVPSETAADRLTGTGSLSQMLRQVESLLHEQGEEPPVAVEPAPGETLESPIVEEETTALSRPAPKSIRVPDRLNDRIHEIEFENMPLVDFLRFTSDFSTIPISLHPESLIWLALTPDAPVSGHLKDSTIAELLEGTLTPLGLAYDTVDSQLVIGRPLHSLEEFREVPFEVADLLGEEPDQLAELTDWISTLIAPDSWQSAGGLGSIEANGSSLLIRNSDPVLFEILFFCERLRLARGLPTRSRYDRRHFSQTALQMQAREHLDKRITLTFLGPTLFTRVLRHIEKTAGIRLLVDWQSLAEEGWNSDAEVTFAINDRPLSEAITELLKPMELEFRIVDQSVFQIASRERLTDRSLVECYPSIAWLRGDSVPLAEFKTLHSHVDKLSVGWESQTTLKLDSLSGTLLVAGNEVAHRELRSLFSKAE